MGEDFDPKTLLLEAHNKEQKVFKSLGFKSNSITTVHQNDVKRTTMAKSIYDTLVIELQSEGKSVGSISIKKTDLDTLMNNHDSTRAQILEDIVKTICPDDRGKDVIYGTGMAVGIQCFNKAMELNKDKLFTLEDMMNCWNKALKFQEHKETLGEFIQSLQQPTEIEVEIVMDICGDKVYAVPELKLDENGCLILKKI